MTREEIKQKLEQILTPKRFKHSLNVMNMSCDLARKHEENEEKAAISGLLHDCARDLSVDETLKLCTKHNIEINEVTQKQPELLHGPVGAVLARELYEIEDMDILNSIRYHTTGRAHMSMMEKIVFIADFIEPARVFPGVSEIREMAFEDINKAILMSFETTIKFVLSKDALLHPLTIEARNNILSRSTAANPPASTSGG